MTTTQKKLSITRKATPVFASISAVFALATGVELGGSQRLPAVLSCGSVAVGLGVAAGLSKKREKRLSYAIDVEKQKSKVNKLVTCFSNNYEKYKGTVHTVNLAFDADITLKEADSFLDALAKENQGKRMDVGTGVFYVFPHHESTMVELNKRAVEWATAQSQSLHLEIQSLRAQLLAAQQLREEPQVVTPQPTWGNIKPNPQQSPGPDPWQGLL